MVEESSREKSKGFPLEPTGVPWKRMGNRLGSMRTQWDRRGTMNHQKRPQKLDACYMTSLLLVWLGWVGIQILTFM